MSSVKKLVVIPGTGSKIDPESAQSSSVRENFIPANAIDGDYSTISHTICEYGIDIWFKLTFSEVHCFTEVIITNSITTKYAWRMHDTKIFVRNTALSTEELCGVLKHSGEYTYRYGYQSEP